MRSYPLFFAVTCALLGPFLDLLKRDGRPIGWRKLLLFGFGCVLLCYIHFFGVVASFSLFATLILARCTDRVSLLRVLIVGGGVGLCLLGLYPFVFGATSISTPGSPAMPLGITTYIPLLFGHPALLIYPVAAVLYFAACAALLLAAGWGIAVRALQHRMEPVDWLLVVAITGCAATILPGLVISTFSALKPSYSIWLLPVFAMLLSLGASKPIGVPVWDRFGRATAAGALLIGAAVGTGVFLVQAPWFVHGPHRIIEAAREHLPPATAIVYGERATYAYGYFPMVYESEGHLPQWLAMPGGIVRITGGGLAQTLPISALVPYRGLVVVDIRPRHYADLRHCLADHCPEFAVSPLIDQLVRSGRWSVVSHQRAFGFYDAVVTTLTQKAPI